MNENILKTIHQNCLKIQEWFTEKEKGLTLPFYLSIDLRDADFKASFVDTNLFPAGFNNLCQNNLKNTGSALKNAIIRKNPAAKEILLITEEHTRNLWYLQNIYSLEQLFKGSGFKVTLGMFHDFGAPSSSLTTAKDNKIIIYGSEWLENNINSFDLIILNNDLTNGIPEILNETTTPVFPSPKLGWHQRSKSKHFELANKLITEFSRLLELDPWLFSSFYTKASNININSKNDRQVLYEHAKELFSKLSVKYNEYDIKQKPYIFLKADSGTYGIGVQAIENPKEILSLNSRARNNLSKGKGGKKTDNYILQEGIPSKIRFQGNPAEVCLYSIENQTIGGFFRYNDIKSSRENLNSRGMGFSTICFEPLHSKECPGSKAFTPSKDNNLPSELEIMFYKILNRIAIIAAAQEDKII
ncbi:glutamate--cysteine ligase [Candidatus Margulisiibacteriota bacterium]